MKLEVLVVDDFPVIRDGLRRILADTDDLIVAGEAFDDVSAMEKIHERAWHLVILDLSMPGQAGVDLIRRIKAAYPQLPILVFSMHYEVHQVVRSIRAGAAGYLLKDDNSDLFLPAIRAVANGGAFFSHELQAFLTSAALTAQPMDGGSGMSD